MSSVGGSDFGVSRAATSMNFATEAPLRTPPQSALLSQPQHAEAVTGNSPGIHITPEKRAMSSGEALDLASPPPRPPQRSTSSDGRCVDGGASRGQEGGTLLQLETPLLPSCSLAEDSRSASTDVMDRARHDTRTTRGPVTSLDASDSTTNTALFSTTALLNATTMPLAPSEGSQDSATAFSPSVHRPTVAGDRRDGTKAGSDGDDVRGRRAGMLDGTAEARDVTNSSAQIAHTDVKAPTYRSVSRSADRPPHGDGAESDDEDEDGLFQETVLFMNNTLHSIGNTRRTPSKPMAPTTPPMRGDSSPVPKMPNSLESTPTKLPRGGPDNNNNAAAMTTMMNASATTASTQAYQTAPASPATYCSTRTAGPFASPLLAPQKPSPPQQQQQQQQQVYQGEPSVSATAADPFHGREQSEYLFIDNHDGTAYLADASLQLDGSYALGQTILLARSSTVASPITVNGTDQRRRHAGHAGSSFSSCGVQSPVVVPQPADRLPVQRDCPAHRPVRGATLPEAVASPASPIPSAFSNAAGVASPLAPSVARVLVRRSPAPARDTTSDGAGAFMPPSFNSSFCFDQTLLVPLDDTLRSLSSHFGTGSMSASPCLPERRTHFGAGGGGGRLASEASSAASYRSAAPMRWENAGSPMVVVPTSPAASFAVYASPRSAMAAPSPASSVSRASPVPHAPSMGRQLAVQQARASRDTRPSRPAQDVIYLVPAGAATTTLTPEDITGQGWIPVHVVDVLPRSAASPVPGSRVTHSNTAAAASVRGGGRTVSPVPTDPNAQAPPPPHNTHAMDEGEEEEEESAAVREQSLSRVLYLCSEDPVRGARNASFSLASTLSASTMDCINRRLSYSVSGWASARQRFGGSVSTWDGMPPATPLTFTNAGPGDEKESSERQQRREPHLTIRIGGQDDISSNNNIYSTYNNNNSSSRSRGRQGSDGGYSAGSPLPLPPATPEVPQREGSPSRCTTTDSLHTTPVREAAVGRPARVAEELMAESHVENSLLTSMSYQRPSTHLTVSEENVPGDYSMSLPLTSSASQSIGLGGRGTTRTSNAESLNMQQQQQQLHHYHPNSNATTLPQHQVLRAPHPRRVSGATDFSQGASLLSFQALVDQSDPPTSGEGEAAQHSRSNLSIAAATSFRTTYCNKRASLGSVRAASLNPGSGPVTSVAAAGLPLSRGTLGVSVNGGGNGPRGVGHTAGYFPAQKKSYPQQYAAAAERRRANRAGGSGGGGVAPAAPLYVNASSLSIDSGVMRSGGVSRNFPQHHPYAHPQQQQQPSHVRRAVAGATGRVVGGGGVARRTGGGRLVPDTSVFLPWAPLTITPEGSVNISRAGGDEPASGARMHLVAFNSSAETSTMTATTTTQTTATTSGAEGRGAQAAAENWTVRDDAAGMAPGALRTLSAAVAAMSRAAGVTDGCNRNDAPVSKEAFVTSFLQHAASQAATSVGENSLSAGSLHTTTTTTRTTKTTTATTASAMSQALGKSLALSRVTVNAHEAHAQDCSGRLDYQSMEATMNHFQASVSAVSAQEPEPRAPTAVIGGGEVTEKENNTATTTGGHRGSTARASVGAVRSSGLREGSAANAVRHAGKTRSPPAQNTGTWAENTA